MALNRKTVSTDQDQPVAQDAPVTEDAPVTQDDPVTQDQPVAQDDPVTRDQPAVGAEPAGEVRSVAPAEPADRDGLGEWVAGNQGPRHGTPSMDADPAGPPQQAGGVATGTGDDVPEQAGAVASRVPADRGPGGLGEAGAALITDEPALRESWLKIQSGFVDDPRGAVSEAAGFVSDVTGTLVTALQDRERALRRSWEADGTDTEGLRDAIREYRSFFELLIKL